VLVLDGINIDTITAFGSSTLTLPMPEFERIPLFQSLIVSAVGT